MKISPSSSSSSSSTSIPPYLLLLFVFSLQRSVKMFHSDGGRAEELLEELGRKRSSEETSGLWRNLRLDWVRNWDQSSRTAVLLSRRHHSGKLLRHSTEAFWEEQCIICSLCFSRVDFL